jgi:hypothetical protein
MGHFFQDYNISLCYEACSTLDPLFEGVFSQPIGFMHLGNQHQYYDLLWASVPIFSLIRGQQCLSSNSGGDFSSSKSCLTLTLTLVYPNFGGNIPIRMPYVKYKDKSTISNTKWPGNRIKRALLREFSIPAV